MNDIQTPEWVKESIIKGLNREQHTHAKYVLSVSWRGVMAFFANKWIRISSIVDRLYDGFVLWLWNINR